jgi:hypothetical protein
MQGVGGGQGSAAPPSIAPTRARPSRRRPRGQLEASRRAWPPVEKCQGLRPSRRPRIALKPGPQFPIMGIVGISLTS